MAREGSHELDGLGSRLRALAATEPGEADEHEREKDDPSCAHGRERDRARAGQGDGPGRSEDGRAEAGRSPFVFKRCRRFER
jgi:hypothetical protein